MATSRVIPRGPLAGLPRRALVDRTRFLTPKQLLSLLNGEAFAEDQGLAFAAHVTVHWQCDPSFDPASWADRTKNFLDKLGRWLKRNGIPVAFAWAHEVGREYGEHTHLLLHLPKAKRKAQQQYQAVTAALAAWIIESEHLATNKVDRFGKPWLPVKITPDKANSFGTRTRRMRSGVLKYLLEGVDPKDVTYTGTGAVPRAEALGIRPKVNVKPIPHKRCGTSLSIGPKARKEAGWRELRSIPELHSRLNPD